MAAISGTVLAILEQHMVLDCTANKCMNHKTTTFKRIHYPWSVFPWRFDLLLVNTRRMSDKCIFVYLTN